MEVFRLQDIHSAEKDTGSRRSSSGNVKDFLSGLLGTRAALRSILFVNGKECCRFITGEAQEVTPPAADQNKVLGMASSDDYDLLPKYDTQSVLSNVIAQLQMLESRMTTPELRVEQPRSQSAVDSAMKSVEPRS